MSDTEDNTTTKNCTYHFTTATCLQLIDRLTTPQVTRELKQLGYSQDSINTIGDLKAKREFLKAAAQPIVSQTLTVTTDSLISLTDDFSRSATETMQNLKESMAEANVLVKSLRELRLPPGPTSQESLHPSPVEDTPPSPLKKPFKKFDGHSFFERFDVAALDAELKFDHDFANRKVAFWGEFAYKYTGGNHAAKPKFDGPIFTDLMNTIADFSNHNDIDFKLFNSCLITKYDTPKSSLPPHSDDEECIVPESDILTVSLGRTRDILFRRRPPGKYHEETLTVSHGDCYLMSRASQDYYDHSVREQGPTTPDGMRISLTFRQLRGPRTDKASDKSNLAQVTQQSATSNFKRVLILSDSKNASFDCSQFREPIRAFKNNMFFLRDLNSHREAINQADIVLISCGINDIRKNHVSARHLHDHVRDFIAQFPGTEFLFDSLSPVALRADPRRFRNDTIDDFNELMFLLSLHTKNFKLFDNLKFGMSHLARDGLHMNRYGKESMSESWIHSVLIRLGFRRGPLPIRQRYQDLHRNFTGV